MKWATLAVALSALVVVAATNESFFPLTKVRSVDGTGNTIGGVAETPLLRLAPADYPGNGSGEFFLRNRTCPTRALSAT